MLSKTVFITSVVNLMFFIAGIDKIVNFNKVVNGLQKRLSFNTKPLLPEMLYQVMILVAILIEIIAPIVIFKASNNRKYRKYGVNACYSLIAFTILATTIYHFPPFGVKYYPFMSNITTVGGLLAISALLSSNE